MKLSPFQKHKQRWEGGCGAHICPASKNRVLLRGKIPCDVLFVGEAPGKSEDVLGAPFKGVAGKELDKIIEKAVEESGVVNTIRMAFTNLVACIPLDEEGHKSGEPDEDSITACQPRLEEIIRICGPRLIVCVGKMSEKKFEGRGYKHSIKLVDDIEMVSITHPSAILQANIAQQSFLRDKVIVKLANAFEVNFGGRA